MERKRMLMVALLISALPFGAFAARAQAPQEDLDAIKRTALDYIEGWYEGDAEKMARSLHPDLAKRMVSVKDGQSQLNATDKEKLVEAARSGRGKSTPAAEQRKDVTILDVFGKTATVKLDARDWVDYLHVVKWNDRWLIINVLWELRPRQ
jgi:hypothetical protein